MLRRLSDLFRASAKSKSITPAKFGMAKSAPPDNHFGWLGLAALITIIVPKLPFGNIVMYPFTILFTWFHEMGHGLTALALGRDFDRLVLMANGNGYAMISQPTDGFAIINALISMGGPLGPAIFGSILILASQTEKARRIALITLASVIIASTAIWVRSIVGWAVLLPLGALIIVIAQRASARVSRFTVQFLGIYAAISMFGQWNYLLSEGAFVDGTHQQSDTGAIAEMLYLPHWFWACSIIAIGGLMIGTSLRRVLRKKDTKWTVH